MNILEHLSAANTAAGRWGVAGGDASARRDEELPPGLLEELEAAAAQLEAAHAAGVARLAEQLADGGAGNGGASAFDEGARHLLSRLAGRGAYERQQGAGEGGRLSLGGY